MSLVPNICVNIPQATTIAGRLDQLYGAFVGSGISLFDYTPGVSFGFSFGDNVTYGFEVVSGRLQAFVFSFDTRHSYRVCPDSHAPYDLLPGWFFLWDDAYMWSAQSEYARCGSHGGRVFSPFFANDAAHGMDGTSLLAGYINAESAGQTYWFTTGSAFSGRLTVQVAEDVWETGHINENINRLRTSVGGRTQPSPLIMSTWTGGAEVNGVRSVGVLKYLYNFGGTAQSVGVVLQSGGVNSFVYASNTGHLVVPISPTFTPDPV